MTVAKESGSWSFGRIASSTTILGSKLGPGTMEALADMLLGGEREWP